MLFQFCEHLLVDLSNQWDWQKFLCLNLADESFYCNADVHGLLFRRCCLLKVPRTLVCLHEGLLRVPTPFIWSLQQHGAAVPSSLIQCNSRILRWSPIFTGFSEEWYIFSSIWTFMSATECPGRRKCLQSRLWPSSIMPARWIMTSSSFSSIH